MSARTHRIPDDVLARQVEASDPATSAWVSANAGSGKTHVLAQRVIRLLLAGVDPAKILCITFTKAAAANMANRVFETLAQWTSFDNATLDAAIRAIGGRPPDAAIRARARRLFATALETPGGLKVQTIHAFCTSLLHQFPFEANVAARFTVLDETATTQLLDSLVLDVLLEGAAHPESAIGYALASAITFAADQTFKDVVRAAIGDRHKVRDWFDAVGGLEAAITGLSTTLGIDPGDSIAAVEADVFVESLIVESEWPIIANALNTGSKADWEHSERFRRILTATGNDRLETYLAIFCTGELKARKNIVTKAIQRKHPALYEQLIAEQARVCALLDRRRAIRCRDRTASLLTIADAVLQRYQVEKDRRGLLDYDDLIDKTSSLFDSVSAAWVLYKLDLGIDHVLIDEAQDTSARQWRIVETLVNEFAAGEGARGIKRTLFAVGDDKQSIFSFQGAAPHRFAEMRRAFHGRFEAAGLPMRNVALDASFRSGASVLGAVDAVFAREDVYRALTADPVHTVHRALPDAAPGVVEIWDLIKPDPREKIEAWNAPFDTRSEMSPQVQLAGKIARTVALWRAQGWRAGEILILVRQRGPLFEAIIRGLTAAGIAVAGADRLRLTDHIAVMDLMALGDALLLPQDDLALATVLRSPLFDISEEQLFALAWQRSGSLWDSLQAKTGDDGAFAQARERLEQLARRAQSDTPFAFYAHVLGATGGRTQLLQRLGPEAADALSEFINLALDYESRETPSLQGFLAWLRAADAEVKRDMEVTRDEVRVMTVHGAKGLEAPIVILADTTTRPSGPRDPPLLAMPVPNAPPGMPAQLVWATVKDDVGPVAAARTATRQEAQEEYARLLYVAMTRAAERLVVCGIETQKRPAGCWYDLVRNALADSSVTEPADDGDGKVLRFRKAEAAKAKLTDAVQPSFALEPPLPAWLIQAATAPAVTSAPIVPSSALRSIEMPAAALSSAKPNPSALLRGRLVHRLLQSLPDIVADRRKAAARRYLQRNAAEFTGPEQDAMLAQVLAILDAPAFARLFAPGSRGEVPIVGRIALADGTTRAVNGQVDRLAVTGEAVLIVDFKTDRPAPRIAPLGYVVQLALYRAVLSRLYPDRPVRAALVWTDRPDFMEVSAADLDRALYHLTSM